jgi:glycosyltransferase involved in cell wall biosynthesis
LQITEVDASLRRDGEVLIVFVGEMAEQDGVDYLLRALAYLSTGLNQRAWRCLLVGEGVAVTSLKKLAGDLKIDDRVEFTGVVPYRAVPRYIGAADICVAPDPSNSYTDRSTIIKLMEYMAQAKPTVAFDLPEHRVTAADAALYATANDEADFARQLARLINDAALRQQLGQSGRARVLGRLAWSHQEGPLLAAYRQALCPRTVPRDLVERERSA